MKIHRHRLVAVVAILSVVGATTELPAQILPKEPISAPTVYSGPPPAGFRVAVTTPTSAALIWNITAGAMTYSLLRASGVGQPWTTLTPTPLPASTLSFTDNSPLDYRITYIYRLVVKYNGTPDGYADLSVTLATPVNPGAVVATQANEGIVQLTWGAVPGVSSYMVLGPGIPNGSAILTRTSMVTSGLPLGTHTWQVGAIYQPGNMTSPIADFSKGTATVVRWKGTYRVTLVGFNSMGTTTDDPRDFDGKGDEIQPTVYWQRFETGVTPNLKASNWARGSTHGDAAPKYKGRVRAGSGQPNGGVYAGDMAPAGFLSTLASGSAIAPSTVTFPMTVWEGDLTRNLDVLILYPVLWESDDEPSSVRALYEQNTPTRTSGALKSSAIQTAINQSGISEVRGALAVQFPPRGPLVYDRPIGIEAVPGPLGTNDAGFFDRVIVLSMRKIEEALDNPSPNPNLPPGTIGLSFVEPGYISPPVPDATNFTGRYALYLRVERLK